MSFKKIVRETLNLSDHKIKKIEMSIKGITIYVDKKLLRKLPCSVCHERCKKRDELPTRIWNHIAIWGIFVHLIYSPKRVKCKNCGTRVEEIPWSRGKSPLSIPLIILLSKFARLLPWSEVAEMFDVSWRTVKRAVKMAVEYGLEKRDLSGIKLIGIDEISRKKGHVYHTNVYDLEKRILLWSREGRTKEVLRSFFDEMGKDFIAGLEGICCDMWDPYIDVIKEKAPHAALVFDKFHIVKHLSNAIDKVRREEVRRLKEQGENVLARTRYIWLKNPENLTPKQEVRLSELQKLNLKVSKAYILKEAFRDFWSFGFASEAEEYLKRWFWWATHSRIKPMRDFAWMLRRHEENILTWFDNPISNGPTEAMNNNAKSISHRARGYRTEDTFSLVLLHCLGGLKLPETVHKFC